MRIYLNTNVLNPTAEAITERLQAEGFTMPALYTYDDPNSNNAVWWAVRGFDDVIAVEWDELVSAADSVENHLAASNVNPNNVEIMVFDCNEDNYVTLAQFFDSYDEDDDHLYTREERAEMLERYATMTDDELADEVVQNRVDVCFGDGQNEEYAAAGCVAIGDPVASMTREQMIAELTGEDSPATPPSRLKTRREVVDEIRSMVMNTRDADDTYDEVMYDSILALLAELERRDDFDCKIPEVTRG